MKTFNDYYNNKVNLSFEDHPFDSSPKHVWVICRYKGKWLLTKHLSRGLEFPGGKVEKNETADDAALREVNEETGAKVDQLYYIGQYCVESRYQSIVKNIYFATIKELTEQTSYFETAGPVLLEEIPTNIKHNETFSFIMKDDVLTYSLAYIKERLSS
ncbi:RNA deprotection pyrophosphohydrolase [Gracilibacillus marinus]|jgi:8-oxo-dGTP diphosphatase|uniref:RNA deprotection pyrophosphohydrolase n=1 Tax=Gracilibacillus marinus TaxID=630535 RepID=A0ABV8VTE2_9BACI